MYVFNLNLKLIVSQGVVSGDLWEQRRKMFPRPAAFFLPGGGSVWDLVSPLTPVQVSSGETFSGGNAGCNECFFANALVLVHGSHDFFFFF